MESEALILIENDADAQKLVAAWPKVDLGDRTEADVLANDDDEVHREWGRLAGIKVGVVRRLYPVLLENGTVAELATNFVRKRIAEGLK